MNLSGSIKYFRTELGLSPKQVYDHVSKTQGFYSGIENGICNPSIQTLEDIADCFDVPVFLLIWKATDRKKLSKKNRIWYDNLSPVIDAIIEEIKLK